MLSNMLAKVVGSMIVICLCCVSISSSSSKVHLNKRIPKKSKRFLTHFPPCKKGSSVYDGHAGPAGPAGPVPSAFYDVGVPGGKIRRDTDAVLLFFCSYFPGHSKNFQRTPQKKMEQILCCKFLKKHLLKKQYFSLATFLCKILGVSSRLTCFFCPLFLQNFLFIRSLRLSLSFTNSSPRRP